MNVNDETLLETYVLDHDTLSDTERYHVEQLIQNDQTAAELLRFFQDFYRAFSAQSADPPEAVVGFVDSLFPTPQKIELLPYEPTKAGNGDILSRSVEENGYVTLATLASPEHHTLARLVLDPTVHQARLFILADDARMYANALVTIDNPSCQVVADAKGCARLDLASAETYRSEMEISAVLSPVVDSMEVDLSGADSGMPIEAAGKVARLCVVVKNPDVAFRIESTAEQAMSFAYLAVEWNDSVEIAPLLENECVIHPDTIPVSVSVRLYG